MYLNRTVRNPRYDPNHPSLGVTQYTGSGGSEERSQWARGLQAYDYAINDYPISNLARSVCVRGGTQTEFFPKDRYLFPLFLDSRGVLFLEIQQILEKCDVRSANSPEQKKRLRGGLDLFSFMKDVLPPLHDTRGSWLSLGGALGLTAADVGGPWDSQLHYDRYEIVWVSLWSCQQHERRPILSQQITIRISPFFHSCVQDVPLLQEGL